MATKIELKLKKVDAKLCWNDLEVELFQKSTVSNQQVKNWNEIAHNCLIPVRLIQYKLLFDVKLL